MLIRCVIKTTIFEMIFLSKVSISVDLIFVLTLTIIVFQGNLHHKQGAYTYNAYLYLLCYFSIKNFCGHLK